jgi:hypothetical protein
VDLRLGLGRLGGFSKKRKARLLVIVCSFLRDRQLHKYNDASFFGILNDCFRRIRPQLRLDTQGTRLHFGDRQFSENEESLMVLRIACVIVGSLVLSFSTAAQTTAANSASIQVPSLIQFSNVATDEAGNTLSGVVSITLSLYTSQEGGTPLWSETQNDVQLEPTGHYSLQLGVTTPNGVPTTLFTTGEARWLGVRIAGQAEQSRVLLLSVPYALKAGDATTIGGLPPSAFVLAQPAGSMPAEWTGAAPMELGLSPDVRGRGPKDHIPIWINDRGDLGISALFQGGTALNPKVGIGTDTPVSTLDVRGGSTIRGPLNLRGATFATSSAVIQSLINDLAGGGSIYLPCGSSFAGPTSFPPGTTIKSLCLTSYSTDPYILQPYTTTFNYAAPLLIGPVAGLDIEGINFNFSGAGNLILTGVRQSVFDMSVNCMTGSPCVLLTATSQSANNVFNRFNVLNVNTGGAIGVQCSAAPGGGFVTDNDFRFMGIDMTPSSGGQITEALGFTMNCDSNHIGTLHMFFTGVNAGNGVVFNDSGTPGIDTDADNEVIDLADITSGKSITGTAYTVNKSLGNRWVEGFGQTSFTTPIAADSTTTYIREFLEEGGIALGTTTLVGYPGPTMYATRLPTGASGTLLQAANLLISETAPTISSGFGSTPSIATNNGTAAFSINVGSGGAASSGVIGLPTATNGWNCWAVDLTNPTAGGGYNVKQTASTASSATLTGYNTGGSVAPWLASDILSVSCFAR